MESESPPRAVMWSMLPSARVGRANSGLDGFPDVLRDGPANGECGASCAVVDGLEQPRRGEGLAAQRDGLHRAVGPGDNGLDAPVLNAD